MTDAPSARADLGVIGGSGFYEFLADAERVAVSTPFGDPSDDAGHRRARGPPRRVPRPARAGPPVPAAPGQLPRQPLGAALGRRPPGARAVRRGLAAAGAGAGHDRRPRPGRRPHLGPGAHRLRRGGPGRARRASPTPTAPHGRRAVVDAARAAGKAVADGGTLVVINGPRFSSRAESLWHQQAGWTVVGMTAMPEAAIARELAMCFTTIALVTDLDAGVEGGEAVTHEEVLRVFAENVDALKQLLRSTIRGMPETEPDDSAGLSLPQGPRRDHPALRAAGLTSCGQPGGSHSGRVRGQVRGCPGGSVRRGASGPVAQSRGPPGHRVPAGGRGGVGHGGPRPDACGRPAGPGGRRGPGPSRRARATAGRPARAAAPSGVRAVRLRVRCGAGGTPAVRPGGDRRGADHHTRRRRRAACRTAG